MLVWEGDSCGGGGTKENRRGTSFGVRMEREFRGTRHVSVLVVEWTRYKGVEF